MSIVLRLLRAVFVTRVSARTKAAAGLAAVLLTSTTLVLASPAQAAPCDDGAGVTVVVDFAALGGGITVACAPGDPDTGIDALQSAGFTPTGTQRYGLAFVCRINNLPPPAVEPCTNTPPVTAYWSYWYATPGGSWTSSPVGPLSHDPAPGAVEGWAFGAGGAPSISPP